MKGSSGWHVEKKIKRGEVEEDKVWRKERVLNDHLGVIKGLEDGPKG